ncbi:hypothetical protein J6590_029477 [Homalodisca vitripennis]|nr:hypothetical protein J6590_029477 [Homalodisca vitripennis]
MGYNQRSSPRDRVICRTSAIRAGQGCRSRAGGGGDQRCYRLTGMSPLSKCSRLEILEPFPSFLQSESRVGELITAICDPDQLQERQYERITEY